MVTFNGVIAFVRAEGVRSDLVQKGGGEGKEEESSEAELPERTSAWAPFDRYKFYILSKVE